MKKETREKQKLNIRLTNLKSNLNSQRAITLIALIVTIIVLLILAGVSLNIVLGDNGIISKSKEAVNKYGESVIKEKEDMDKLYNILLSEKGELPDDPDKVKATGIQLAQTTAELGVGETLNLATGLTIEPENVTTKRVLWESNNSEIAKVEDGMVTALSEGTTTITVRTTDGSNLYATCVVTVIEEGLPSTEITKPYLPGDDFNQVAGTDLDNGLVIEDGIGNQYVWIEVPKTAEVYPTAGLNITEFTSEEYTTIENDLNTYVKDYKEKGFKDNYCADTIVTGWFKNAGEYDAQKQKMLKSVYTNGGFWIGRYEAGKPEKEGMAPISKANAYPYNEVTRTKAHELAKQVDSGNCESSLMFGMQWDLVMKFLETKKVLQSDLKSNSTYWGNYKENKTSHIDSTDAKFYWGNGEWKSAYNTTIGGIKLLTTGASSDFKKMNIYDLAGNVWEWTLEYATDVSGYVCTKRGGANEEYDGSYPVNKHSYSRQTSEGTDKGFRVSLY